MYLSFDCGRGEVEEVLQAIALRMQVLSQQDATPAGYRAIKHLQHFARQLGPVIEQDAVPAAQVLVLEVRL